MESRVERFAKRFWDQLDRAERNELGDQLVWGTFDWMDWLDAPPPRGFLSVVDRLRILWEQTNE